MRAALLPDILQLVGLTNSGAATALFAVTTIAFLLIEAPLSLDADRRNRPLPLPNPQGAHMNPTLDHDALRGSMDN